MISRRTGMVNVAWNIELSEISKPGAISVAKILSDAVECLAALGLEDHMSIRTEVSPDIQYRDEMTGEMIP